MMEIAWKRSTRLYILIFLAFMLMISGCGNGSNENNSAADVGTDDAGFASEGTASSDSAGDAPVSDSSDSTGDMASEEPSPSTGESESPSDSDSPSKEDRPAEDDFTGERPNPTPQAGQLTAGEWSDLEHWDWWRRLMNHREWSSYRDHWGFYPDRKITVKVTSQGEPVVDAIVTLREKKQDIWEARTGVDGEAHLFDGLFTEERAGSLDLLVETPNGSKAFQLGKPNASETVHIDWNNSEQTPDTLDLMFVVDTTGSMGDELSYLQSEIKSVINRVSKANNDELSIRFSNIFYRDKEDEYEVLPFRFTTNIDKAVKQLSEQSADGGGDYEEAVEAALEEAIEEQNWSDEARARLLFLVLDAPPHHTKKNIERIQELTAQAAEAGIRIIPIASSGVDKDTEFLLRFLSVSTGGTYVFLTDDSGIGNSHIEPTIGQYEVEQLNNLLVQIINSYTEVQ